MHVDTQVRIESTRRTDKDYAALLRRVGLKVTRCRIAMLELIEEEGRHATADEITNALRDRGFSVDRVTIYRNVDRMLQAGILATIYVPGRAMRVGICRHPGSDHHHHIVCTKCGKVDEVESCFLQDIWDQVKVDTRSESGYQLTGHVMQYVGVCPDCQNGNRQ